MRFDKSMLLDLLKSQGKDQQAQEADQQLPEQVDTEQHAGLMQKLGVDPQHIVQALSGGGGLSALKGTMGGGGEAGGEGGLGGKLGGLLGR